MIINLASQHIAKIKGNVKSCSVAKEDDKKKCKGAIDKEKNEKEKEIARKDEVQLTLDKEDDDVAINGTKRQPNLNPMDKYASKIDREASIDSGRTLRQQTIHNA